MKNEKIIYNKAWVPNWLELKEIIQKLIWEQFPNKKEKRKKFLWLI